MANRRVGLIAGSGLFPIEFARAAVRDGYKVVCVGVAGEAPAELASLVDRFYTVPVSRVGQMIRLFKRHHVRRIVMAGKVTKQVMHTPGGILTEPGTCTDFLAAHIVETGEVIRPAAAYRMQQGQEFASRRAKTFQ